MQILTRPNISGNTYGTIPVSQLYRVGRRERERERKRSGGGGGFAPTVILRSRQTIETFVPFLAFVPKPLHGSDKSRRFAHTKSFVCAFPFRVPRHPRLIRRLAPTKNLCCWAMNLCCWAMRGGGASLARRPGKPGTRRPMPSSR